jgi:hypothetical protein
MNYTNLPATFQKIQDFTGRADFCGSQLNMVFRIGICTFRQQPGNPVSVFFFSGDMQGRVSGTVNLNVDIRTALHQYFREIPTVLLNGECERRHVVDISPVWIDTGQVNERAHHFGLA